MMKQKFILAFAILMGVFTHICAQVEVSSLEKAQALFIYNFSRHIGWPETSYTDEGFVISVVGNKTLYNEIVKLTKDKLVGRYKIMVKLCNTSEEIGTSHMLVLGEKATISLDKSKFSSSPTLIINTNEKIQNGDIIFKLVDQKMNYVLSRSNIKSKGLIISKQIQDMAINVI